MKEDEFYGKSISLADPNFSEKVSQILNIQPTPNRTGGKSMNIRRFRNQIRVSLGKKRI